jgi:hypothetical protein
MKLVIKYHNVAITPKNNINTSQRTPFLQKNIDIGIYPHDTCSIWQSLSVYFPGWKIQGNYECLCFNGFFFFFLFLITNGVACSSNSNMHKLKKSTLYQHLISGPKHCPISNMSCFCTSHCLFGCTSYLEDSTLNIRDPSGQIWFFFVKTGATLQCYCYCLCNKSTCDWRVQGTALTELPEALKRW